MDKDELKKIDEHVGRQCRLIRMSKKMSQETVADSIGLTFQQVQKYELGKNRISASRLYQLSVLFKISPILFFDGLPTTIIGEPKCWAIKPPARQPSGCKRSLKESSDLQRNEKAQPCGSLAATEAFKAKAAKQLVPARTPHNFVGRGKGPMAAVFASQGDNAVQLAHVLQC